MTFKSLIAATALIILSSSNANATVVTFSTEGTLSGRDGIGWFSSAPGTELESVGYKFTMKYDPDRVGPRYSDESRDVAWNLPFYVPLVWASLKVGDHTLAVGHTGATTIWNVIADGTPNGDVDQIDFYSWTGHGRANGSFFVSQTIESRDATFVLPYPRLDNEFIYKVQPGDFATGTLDLYDGLAPGGFEWSGFVTTITSVSLTSRPGQIPEPGSLALIGAGLFAASRFRRKKVQ